jgi:CO/xanthine dehydrogenase Mo-binding subunit
VSRYFGKRVRRLEDHDLLTGAARFIDDIRLPGTLHAAFVRSDLAHARVLAIDAQEARAHPGVLGVFTAGDLGDYNQPSRLLVPPPAVEGLIFHPAPYLPLASDRIRHVGEPIAVVVATDRYTAEDAAEKVRVDLEALEAVADPERALAADAPILHDEVGSNLAAEVKQRKGDYQAARAAADVVVRRTLRYDRGIGGAIENRGVLADWNAAGAQLRVWDTTQCPVLIRDALAGLLELSERQVRVIAPAVGGGFGPKSMRMYPEEVLLPWIAMRLERPVQWVEDRSENFYATTQERLQIHDAEIALTHEGKILGVRDHFVHDNGAYASYGLVVPLNSQSTVLGCYDIPALDSEFRAVFTNKPMVTPVRGAGHQHGTFVIERLLDAAAEELGIDRVEIRRRNLLRPDQFPHAQGILKSRQTLTYDSGNFAPSLERAVEMIGYQAFVDGEQDRLRREGRRVGVGVVTYIEGTGVGPYEGARVSIEPGGRVRVATGVATQGQGHYTTFAQIVADELGVDVASVDVITGDTGEFHWGTGTFASRSAVVGGNACRMAAIEVRGRALAMAATLLQTDIDQLVLADGRVALAATPERSLSLSELAARAIPRGPVGPDTEPGLEATAYFGPEHGAMANGVHAMKVEVDPETFDVSILDYVVVHDCGRVLNPLIVEGQVHGGATHGIGNAFYEKLHFSDDGQLLNATLSDYLLPTSTEVPRFRIAHVETAAPGTPLGVKGAGESGGIATGSVFAQAVEDALRPEGVRIDEIPLSPDRVFELVREARQRRGENR